MILLNGSNMSPAKKAQHRKQISSLNCYERDKQGMGGRSAAEGCPVSLRHSAAIENCADVDEQARSEPCVVFHLDSLLFMSKVTLRPGLNAPCSHSGFFSLSCPQLDNPVVHQCVSLWQNGFSTHSQLLHRERNTRAVTLKCHLRQQPGELLTAPFFSTSLGHYPLGLTASPSPPCAPYPAPASLDLSFPQALMKLPPKLITSRAGALWPVNPHLCAWLTFNDPAL